MPERNATPTWLKGCGVGCGFLVFALVLVAGGCFLVAHKKFRELREAVASQERLIERFGKVEEFTPPKNGAPAEDRVELFLAIREQLGPSRRELEAELADFPPDSAAEGEEGFVVAFSVLADLGSLLGPVGRYVEARNELLLGEGMSLGEYLYIYSLAYYSWLGHSPEDGPVITKEGPAKGERWLSGDDDSSFSPRKLRDSYHRMALAFAENQLKSLGEGEAGREEVAQEVEALRSDAGRVLWQDGVPPAVLNVLEPYHDPLETSYSPSVNCFELAQGEVRQGISFSR